MRDKLLALTDRLPRWGELTSRQRISTSLVAMLVAVVLAIGVSWAAGVFTDETPPAPAATGPSIEPGLVDCSRTPTDGYSDMDMIAALGDTALPYRVNLADIATTTLDTGQLLVLVSVCTGGSLSGDQLKDVGTVVAQQIKAHSADASRIDTLCVQDIGSGTVSSGHMAGQVVTQFLTHPFALAAGVYSQRSAWVFDLEASE